MTRKEILDKYPNIRVWLVRKLDAVEYYNSLQELQDDAFVERAYEDCPYDDDELVNEVVADIDAYAKDYFAKREQEEKRMDNELVKVENQQVVTDSLNVAEHFDKQHKNVLQAIENLVAENSAAKKMFYETTHENRGKNYKMYLMNRDGFALLAMGFTGKKAVAWKVKYIEAFNAMEQKLKELAEPKKLSPAEEMARGLLAAQKMLAEKDARIKELEPKGVFADAMSASKSSILVGELAKILRGNGVKIGQNKLFDWLRSNGFLMKQGSSKNMPTQKAMELGLFEIKEGSYVNGDGVNIITKTPKVTGKGQQYFVNKFLH